MKQNKSLFDKIFIIVVAVILSIYCVLMIFPLLWGIVTSFKDASELLGIFPNKPNWMGWPKKFVTSNYELVFKFFNNPEGYSKTFYIYWGTQLVTHKWNANFAIILINTLFYTIVGSLIQAVLPAIAGYMCVMYKNKVSSLLNVVTLTLMSLPIIGNTAATITLLRNLNLYDSWIGNFIQKFHFMGMYFFVFQAFFESMSNSYAEAAEVDGASQFRVQFTIYMPLAIKMVSTIVLIYFVSCWNDYQTPYMYLPTKPTLAYVVYMFCSSGKTNIFGKRITAAHKIAACMTIAVPITILFVFLKDKIMGNISIGGVKE